jgi:hypothetical protein
MNPIRRIRCSLAVLTGLVGTLLTLAVAAPAAFAKPLPPPDGFDSSGAPVPVQVITEGGMPGWQIAMIALGTALFAAVAAVLLDRARLARRGVNATAS